MDKSEICITFGTILFFQTHKSTQAETGIKTNKKKHISWQKSQSKICLLLKKSFRHPKFWMTIYQECHYNKDYPCGFFAFLEDLSRLSLSIFRSHKMFSLHKPKRNLLNKVKMALKT